VVWKCVCVACAFFLSVAMLGIELSVSSARAADIHPIGKLAGRWAGGGTLVPTYGRNEQFRCIVTYAVEDESSRIRQHLRCQGDKTRFDAVTRLDIENRRVTGVWADNVYSLSGTVQGKVTDKGFDVWLLSSFFQARMMVATSACEQSVKLIPEGVESMKEIAAVLTKSDRAKICDPNRVIVPPVPIPAVRPTDVARR
jgi:hypothetical protein